jgi:6-phosphofructokinase 1
LATVQGSIAVKTVLKCEKDSPAQMVGMRNNKIIPIPLMEAVEQTKKVSTLINQKKFVEAMELRDSDFNTCYNAYIETSIHPKLEVNSNV